MKNYVLLALALAASAFAKDKPTPQYQIEVLGTDTTARPYFNYSANSLGAYAHTGVIRGAEVSAIMPDGTHVTLVCHQGLRKCAALAPGTYNAKISGNSVFIVAHQLDGKEFRIKYTSVAPGQQ